MKTKNFLALLLLFVLTSLHAQTYYKIVFTGEPDSVCVASVLFGTSVTLHGTDTLHLKLAGVSVQETDKSKRTLVIYPNPMDHSCRFEFENPTQGRVEIQLLNTNGKMVHKYANKLSAGVHLFELSGVPAGVYVLHVKTENFRISGSFVSKYESDADIRLIHEKETPLSMAPNPGETGMKAKDDFALSFRSIVVMDFAPGDWLKFTGYKTNSDDDIEFASPTGDQTIAFTFCVRPGQPSAISGNSNPCQGTSESYSVAEMPGANFIWTVPDGWTITTGQNTNNIEVTVGSSAGNIAVTPSNNCGSGTAQMFSVATRVVPDQPTAISGMVNPCRGTTELSYTVTNEIDVTYFWTVPNDWTINSGQNTNNIIVTAGSDSGKIIVAPSNICGAGLEQILNVTTLTAPEQPIAGTHLALQTQIVWNWNPITGAKGYKYNTINSYETAIDIADSTSFAQTNLTCNTAYTLYIWSYNDCSHSSPLQLMETTVICPFGCGSPVTFTYNGNTVTYGTVLSTNNRCWLDRNLGATQVATSSADAASYGDLFQKGRLDDGHQLRNSETTNFLSSSDVPGHSKFILVTVSPRDWRSPQNMDLWQGVNAINNPCPSGFSVPTVEEWESELMGWSVNNADGAFDSPLKLPLGGTRGGSNGIIYNAGSEGHYWTSSPYYYQGFYDFGNIYETNYNSSGLSVRCIKDCPVPDQPSTIIGEISPCQGTTGLIYAVTNDSNTTYLWTVPVGWSIIEGQNTNSITVIAGTASGIISVTPSNDCGIGTPQTLDIYVKTLPSQPSVINGNQDPCQGETQLSYSVISIPGVSYFWAVPEDWTIISGQGTNIISVDVGTNGGIISVTPENECGIGSARTLTVSTHVLPGQPSEIIGNEWPCDGTIGLTYSVFNEFDVTYIWTVPTGWTITSGQNTNSITVTVGNSSGNITVTPMNQCGNGTESILAVNTQPGIAEPTPGTHMASQTIIVWNWNIVAGAFGYKYNTENNYATATDNGTSTTYTQTGLTCNTSYTLYVWAYNECGNSPYLQLSQTTASCTFACGSPVTFTYNGSTVTYGTVASANNRCWLDRNLGATQVATSSADAASYGHYFQWGRLDDGHQVPASATTTTLSNSDVPGHNNFIMALNDPWDWRSPQNDNLWQGEGGSNNPCPEGYRLPTQSEWDTERASWSTNNAAGAFASPLKLPAAGHREIFDGSVSYSGSLGFYWSSTINEIYIKHLYFYSVNASMEVFERAYGLSVRCIKD